MTVDSFRGQKIKNTRLAWQVYGEKIPMAEYGNFTIKELETILLVEEDPEKIQELKKALNGKHHWT
jgi:hypothetical protein